MADSATLMAERRIVMEVRVQWVTEDDDTTVEQIMKTLDAKGIPSPIEYVEKALFLGSPSVNFKELGIEKGFFEIRVNGPVAWSAAYGNDD